MSECTQCGTKFVGTPENPPQPGLCKYCEIMLLKEQVSELEQQLERLVETASIFVNNTLRVRRHLGNSVGDMRMNLHEQFTSARALLEKGKK